MHNFCLLNIKRPVLSFVFSLLLVVFGLYTFFELSTRELPKNLQPPEVVISTKYTGASPSIIASEISEPIELAVGGAEGIGLPAPVGIDRGRAANRRFGHAALQATQKMAAGLAEVSVL